jgi:hypothetical protein
MADKINPSGNKGLGINFLPNFFKTDANKRFIQATVDQLMQPGTVKKVNGFVGREYAKATTGSDIFVEASDAKRQHYQLEPSFVIQDTLGNNTFFKDYIDYINQLSVFGANVSNHQKINKQEFYTWNPHIDWDKFVNFQNYYWLSYGPQTIKIYGQELDVTSTYTVNVQDVIGNNQYVFTPDGLSPNPVIKLYRGQTYHFEINSSSNPFSIKTARSPGTLDRYSDGVTNNAIESGTLTFVVPNDAPSILYYQSEFDETLGGVFQVMSLSENSFINVADEILGKKTYTLSNGTPLSNGMRVSFGGDVYPATYKSKEFYVEGVGTAINLIDKSVLEVTTPYSSAVVVPFDSEPFDSDAFGDTTGFARTPDYMVINRASADHNGWSRYNRWFHKDVIEASANYNNSLANLDQTLRAVRPIIEFDANLKLYNFGTTAIADIDLVDTFTQDAFSIIEGTAGYNIDGVTLAEGQRIIFLADTDRLVKNNIYQVKFIDVLQSNNGSRQISLVKIAEPKLNDVSLIKQGGKYAGLMYWFNGTTWLPAQQKFNVNQAPLFDVVDDNGYSYGDTSVYEGSTFAGTKVFSYKTRETPSMQVGDKPFSLKVGDDATLGFPLSFRNIENIGDIVFDFNLATDTFNYKEIVNLITKNVATGYLVKTDFAGSLVYENGWQKGTAAGVQAAIRIYKNSNKVNDFQLDIFDDINALDDLILKIYVNGNRLQSNKWSVTNGNRYKKIVLNTDITTDDVLTIKAYTLQSVNSNGFYEIPINLQNNPLNETLTEFTLGEVIDHVGSIVENTQQFAGAFPGAGNLRDIGNATQYGTKFVQHSGPASLSLYHITSQTNNIVRALEQSRDVYNQFKKNFISIAETLGIDGSPIQQVNLILAEINKDKPSTFPYYFSDMVPYRANAVSDLTVIDSRIKTYPLKNVFNLDTLSSKAVGVYLNGSQLLYGSQYTFDNQGFVIISATVALQEDDLVTLYEYDSTDGSFIPETPTKLGMWPKYEPKLYKDTTVNLSGVPAGRWMIQGHDGSQVLAYGNYDAGGDEDYRDAIILELEKRIFNNIKVEYNTEIFDIADVLPSYTRASDYNVDEFNQVLAPTFYKWTSLVDRDFSKPLSYNKADPFTYNYSGFATPDNRPVPGYWRGVYRWMLDTDRPHICPWEMLGFSIEPYWWTDLYGPAPYTSDNKIMWQDIASGIIRKPGVPAIVNKKYVKPFLMDRLPVDESGNLISPSAAGLASGIFTNSTSQDYVFGDVSPVEGAWRRSSYFPFSIILTSLLLTPSKTFGILLDRSRIVRNLTGQLVYKDTGLRITPADIVLPSIYSSQTRVQTAGIINYIANYILSDNLKSFTDYEYDLSNIASKLSYRVGSFTSKEKFNLLLDSKTPLSQGSVFVPKENYVTILNKSSPIKRITYSGVVITKLSEGYEVKGYSKTQPYFKYYEFLQSGVTINVGGISESFVNWVSNQTYVVGKVVKYNNRYYRTTGTHTSKEDFELDKFQVLTSLPVNGGKSAVLRKLWSRTNPITAPYGTIFRTIQEVIDFLLGYGEWLKDEGFIFDEFNTNLNAITNWETSAKEFLFWTTQNWSSGQDKWKEWQQNQPVDFDSIVRYNGDYYRAIRTLSPSPIFDEESFVRLDGLSSVGSSVISLSPSAEKITFSTGLSVVDDIRNAFNGYEIYKVDGTPLEAIFINSYREDNAVSYSPRTADGIYGATFYLVQHEHVMIMDNLTMFNDTLYAPASGYKQDRIKVAGYVSSDWYGGFNIPGFILDVAKIQEWAAWKDYDLGDIVKYKEFFYTSSKFLPGTELFVDNNWIRLEGKPSSQLIPNFNYKASQFLDFYSLDSDNFDQGQQKMAQHLIGYQKRQYLENIIQDDVSEFKFYQGMIREKGTQNSLNKLFDVLGADNEDSLKFYEEWAIRVGQYGASEAFESIEFILDESLFRNNPQGFELTNTPYTLDYSDNIIRQNQNQVYLKPVGYNNNPWPVLTNYKPYFRSAGHVRSEEVFLTLKSFDDINNTYVDSNKVTQQLYPISSFTEGNYVWITFEKQSWNVYRYTNTDIVITNAAYNVAGKLLTLTTSANHTLAVGSYIGLTGVDLIKSFYKIQSVTSNTIVVSATITGWPSPFTQSSQLEIYNFVSHRVATVNDIDTIISSTISNGEKLWIDDAGSKQWATWAYNRVYARSTVNNNNSAANLKFGKNVLLNKKGNVAIVTNDTGQVHVYDVSSTNASWIQRQTILPPFFGASTSNQPSMFGETLAISPDGRWLAIGSPNISRVRSNYVGNFNPTLTYSNNNVVSYAGRPYVALSAVPAGTTPSTNATYWKLLDYIPTNTTGTDNALVNHGVISIYEKDSTNVFSLIDTLLSPVPVANGKLGSTVAFGEDVLYVTELGNTTNTVYTLIYSPYVYHTTSYNPVGSFGNTVALTSVENILPGMTVVGTGFSSKHLVISVNTVLKKVLLTLPPTTTPVGIISFSLTNWRYDSSEIYTGATVDNYGSSIEIRNGNQVLVIAASGGNTTGKVNVTFRAAAPPVTFTIPTPAGATENFGTSISLSEDATYLAIADNLYDSALAGHTGKVQIYSQSGNSYVATQSIKDYLPANFGNFGSKVAFMNNYKTLVVYSENADPLFNGQVDVYDMYGSTWNYSETLTIETASNGFGTGFAANANKILISSPLATVGSFASSGTVYDYTKPANTYSWQVTHSQVAIPDVSKIKTAFLYNKLTGELIRYLDVIDPAQGKIPGPATEEINHNTFYDPATYSVGTDAVTVDSSTPWGKAQVGQLWWDLRTVKFINSYDSDMLYRTSTWNTLATGATVDICEWVETTLLPEAWNKLADTESGLAAGISGTSLYGNTVYSLRQRYDTVSQSTSTLYYYWVKNKKTIPNITGRYQSAQSVSNLIANPRGEAYTYLSLTGINSFSLVNSQQYLEDTNVVLSVEYWLIDKVDQNIHSQWKIINEQSGTVIPSTIEAKWIDSLCGKDLNDRTVPDLLLPAKLRYGVENRPRQGMFINRFEALKQLIEQANTSMSATAIARNKDVSQLNLYDVAPSLVTGLYDSTQNTAAELRFVNIGAYRRPVLTLQDTDIIAGRITNVTVSNQGRGYLVAPYITFVGTGTGASARAIINAAGQITGVTILSAGEGYTANTVAVVRDYCTLVLNDIDAQNNWSIYSYDPIGKVWSRIQSQKYDVRNYRTYVDWYDTGYNQFTALDHSVDTLADLLSILASIGQIIKVRTVGTGGWQLLEKYASVDSLDYTQSYKVVGIESGTVRFNSSLYQALNTNTGYDGSTYDSIVYDNSPATELRIILNALKNDIFIDDLKSNYLNAFLTTIRYALSEQVYLDWIFKTSFVKSIHNVGSLSQHTTYRSDNLSNFQDYISEVKPYKSKIREYISAYQSTDTTELTISDFDLPPVYRNGSPQALRVFVESGKIQADDAAIQTQPWKSWYDNVGYRVTELKIIDGGSFYINEPVVKITSDSGSGATARAFFANGKINRIVLLTPGTGYLSAPTIELVGGFDVGGTPAKVIAIIGKGLTRSNLIKIKFDRVSNSYYITKLQETETFSATSSKLKYALKWAPDVSLEKFNEIERCTITINDIPLLRENYSLSVVKSTSAGFTTYAGLLTLETGKYQPGTMVITYYKNQELLNASDRIQYYYNPQSGDLGKDLAQLMTGVDYGGVIISGLGFEESTGWGALPYFMDKWDGFDPTFDDYVVEPGPGVHDFTLPYVPALNEKLNVYYIPYSDQEYVSNGTSTQYQFDNNVYSPKFGAYKESTAGGVETNYINLGSTGTRLKVASTNLILPGMTVYGYGVGAGLPSAFTSNQTVVRVIPKIVVTAASGTGTVATLNFAPLTEVLTNINIVSTAGEFTCSQTSLTVGQTVTVTGTRAGGKGTILGWTSGKVYYIIVTNGSTRFQLSESLGGTAVTTTQGKQLGLTYTYANPAPFVAGETIIVAGMVPSSYNGTYSVISSTISQVTFSSAVTASMTTAGTIDTSKVIISSSPNILPTGVLTFTQNVPGATVLQLDSVAGIKVGDKVETSAVSAFNYDTVVTEVINSTKTVKLNQIIITTIPVGAVIKFSRSLVTPIDLYPPAGNTVTLTEALSVDTVFTITGSYDPVRIDDPTGAPTATNPYVVMSTITGDGTTDTVSIPSTFPINANDKIIIRKSTSDGSRKPVDADYDTALSGGAFAGNYATGAHTSATGFAADDIILDGDGLVTPTSSPATEEVVPGQVVDAVAIKVYDQPSRGSANIKIANYLGDNTTTTFDIGQTPNSKEAIIVKWGNDILDSTEYTVDYRNRTVTLDPSLGSPVDGEFVSIYSIGFNGSNILDVDHFVGDGATTEFITKAKWATNFTSLVYVDGIAQSPDSFRTDATYDSANRIAFRFGVAPAAGALINFIVVAGTEQTFAVTKTEKILTDGRFNLDTNGDPLTTSTYALVYQVGNNLPNESNMIVKVNDTIISGPINSYFTIESNKLNYKLDATKVVPYSTTISDIKVYVENIKLSQGPDYTVEAGGITIKLNKISRATYLGKTLVVSVVSDQGYTFDSTTNEITFGQIYQSTDSVEVISSYNHDILDIQRTEVTVSTTLSYTEGTVEYYSYKSLTSGLIPLDRTVIDDSYVWVLHNDRLLIPSIEYKLLSDKKTIQLAFTPAENDIITLTTFGSNVMVPNISYMQFKDMLNRFHYKRLNANKRTKLLVDLRYNDTTITVADASAFDVPNIQLNKPGIVEIYGERIEYFSIAANPAGQWILGRLRRGTLGTGAPVVHKIGTFVQDIGYSETMPYIETTVIEQVVSDGTNIVPLKFAPMKDIVDNGYAYTSTADWTSSGLYKTGFVSNIPSGYMQADDIEVFVGGYGILGEWTANTKYHVGDVVTVGSYTYRATLDHISGTTFESLVSSVIYNADGTVASTVATDVAASWAFFIGNIRLKKQPYRVHNVNQAEYSPAGDMQLDAEFAVSGTENEIFLTNKLSLGTRVTVVKRVGADWDGKNSASVLYDDSKVARFLRAEPGVWYEESNPNRT